MKLVLEDVRFGNWVYNSVSHADVQVDIVVLKMIDHTQNVVVCDSDFEGIELTPTILIKSGFDAFDKDVEYLGLQFTLRHEVNNEKNWFTLIKDVDKNSFKFEHYYDESSHVRDQEPIRYVHQLQNLYFALYGKELHIVL